MRIDWWTLALQAVNVLVLVWILGRFLFKPVAAMIAQRQAAAAKLLDEARAARTAATAERDAAQAEAGRLAAAHAQALAAAQAEGERAKAAALDQARAEAAQLHAAAEAEIARAQREAAADNDARAAKLALDIAARLLERLPSHALVDGFADGLATALAALPASTRAGFGADGAPLRLVSARALSADELQSCRAAVARALGREVALAPEVDPALVAGLELRTPHAEVRNSLRADLTRLAAELNRDDAARS